jgi:hypothetical protein
VVSFLSRLARVILIRATVVQPALNSYKGKYRKWVYFIDNPHFLLTDLTWICVFTQGQIVAPQPVAGVHEIPLTQAPKVQHIG